MFDAVIFDMDGVLIDSEIIYFRWLQEFLEDKGCEIPDEGLKGMVGLSSVQGEEKLGRLCHEAGFHNLWNEYMEKCGKRKVVYQEILIPGAKELLEFLKANKVKTGLASSSDMKNIERVLDDTGLKEYFAVVLSGEMFQESKPNPEIYCRAAELLKTVPSQCIVIEDSVHGIAAGKAAGAYVIAREENRFGFSQALADAICPDMNRIKDAIRELLFAGSSGQNRKGKLL